MVCVCVFFYRGQSGVVTVCYSIADSDFERGPSLS